MSGLGKAPKYVFLEPLIEYKQYVHKHEWEEVPHRYLEGKIKIKCIICKAIKYI